MRKSEIGGYFELDTYTGRDYYADYIHFNLARTALVWLFNELKCKKIFAPYFLCDSVIHSLEKSGFETEFYNIDESFKPLIKKSPKKGEYIFVVNHYGQHTDGDISDFKTEYGNIVLDNTHAYFQRPVKGVPTVYSCRKFFGLPDGAILAYDGEKPVLPTDKSAERMAHILGRVENGASAHYNEMLCTADSYYKTEPMIMSPLTENLLRGIDYEAVRKRRNENYAALESMLKCYKSLDFKAQDGAFCYPFYVRGRGTKLRKALADKKIYVPVYWGNVIKDMPDDSTEYRFAADILALPCDQRYNGEDMKAVAEEVIKLLK